MAITAARRAKPIARMPAKTAKARISSKLARIMITAIITTARVNILLSYPRKVFKA
jgi:hypothetical protein